jgi:hypothetical protein
MKTTNEQKELQAALFAAWQAFPVIAKTKQGQAGNRSFMYAPLDLVLDAVRPVLVENNLLLTQGTEGHSLVTRLEHVPSGEWREHHMPMNEQHANMQSYGIELTYRRRYAMVAMLGIVTEDDTDGIGGQPKRRGANHQTESVGGSSARDALRDAFERLQPELQDDLRKVAAHMTTAAVRSASDAMAVFDMAASRLSDQDPIELKKAAWYLLDAKTRSTIKKEESNK